MSAYRRDSDENQYFFFDKKMVKCYKNTMKFGIKSAILLKKDLIVNLFTMKSI